MDMDFQLIPVQLQMMAAAREIKECLPACEQYGLTLSDADIQDLVAARKSALSDSGRIEFNGGILPKLINAFCDSPFAERDTWAATLMELQEAFYYYKSDAAEYFSDDELIEFMVKVFNGCAQGSTEYLIGTSLAELCRYARQGSGEYNDDVWGDRY